MVHFYDSLVWHLESVQRQGSVSGRQVAGILRFLSERVSCVCERVSRVSLPRAGRSRAGHVRGLARVCVFAPDRVFQLPIVESFRVCVFD